jgi:hypothetical protein
MTMPAIAPPDMPEFEPGIDPPVGEREALEAAVVEEDVAEDMVVAVEDAVEDAEVDVDAGVLVAATFCVSKVKDEALGEADDRDDHVSFIWFSVNLA